MTTTKVATCLSRYANKSAIFALCERLEKWYGEGPLSSLTRRRRAALSQVVPRHASFPIPSQLQQEAAVLATPNGNGRCNLWYGQTGFNSILFTSSTTSQTLIYQIHDSGSFFSPIRQLSSLRIAFTFLGLLDRAALISKHRISRTTAACGRRN